MLSRVPPEPIKLKVFLIKVLSGRSPVPGAPPDSPGDPTKGGRTITPRDIHGAVCYRKKPKNKGVKRKLRCFDPESNKWISKADKAVLPQESINIDDDDEEEEEGEPVPDTVHKPLDGGRKDDDKDDSGGPGEEARIMGGPDEGAGAIPQGVA